MALYHRPPNDNDAWRHTQTIIGRSPPESARWWEREGGVGEPGDWRDNEAADDRRGDDGSDWKHRRQRYHIMCGVLWYPCEDFRRLSLITVGYDNCMRSI